MSNFAQLIFRDPVFGTFNFRPPCDLRDSTHTTLPTGTNPVIDGVSVVNGQRVLFTNLTSNNNTVYKASDVTNPNTGVQWHTTIDNPASSPNPEIGDILLIQEGSAHTNEYLGWDGSGTWQFMSVPVTTTTIGNYLRTDGTNDMVGNLLFNPDNTYTIGNYASNRAAYGYFGSGLIVGAANATPALNGNLSVTSTLNSHSTPGMTGTFTSIGNAATGFNNSFINGSIGLQLEIFNGGTPGLTAEIGLGIVNFARSTGNSITNYYGSFGTYSQSIGNSVGLCCGVATYVQGGLYQVGVGINNDGAGVSGVSNIGLYSSLSSVNSTNYAAGYFLVNADDNEFDAYATFTGQVVLAGDNGNSGIKLLSLRNAGTEVLGVLNNGGLASAVTQTTLTGSAGTAVFSQPLQGSSYKKAIIYLNGFTDTGTQIYTFPTAFSHTPYVYGLTAGVAGATTTTTTIKFTVTTQTGFVFAEGY
jgi:hypothetical protein